MATESFKVIQTFGIDYTKYKILVQAKSSNRYFVWYEEQIGADLGQEVLITYEGNNWQTINNPLNGRRARITQAEKVN
ncbi:MAG TPA: hypothetical protein IGS52_05290 [Oscillatoriaceae cyanobacterium M33_DOE_052]|uniref:Uncharacterized protein n=1 Tax=Planktothricoides sp. SpSt-374 TaxID=2282167 RepID=A0A7C3ZP54_9CYAN|nr:hypothetical protein [Oscillatoriaceae cyanobacterium M33_DOE_052]